MTLCLTFGRGFKSHRLHQFRNYKCPHYFIKRDMSVNFEKTGQNKDILKEKIIIPEVSALIQKQFSHGSFDAVSMDIGTGDASSFLALQEELEEKGVYSIDRAFVDCSTGIFPDIVENTVKGGIENRRTYVCQPSRSFEFGPMLSSYGDSADFILEKLLLFIFSIAGLTLIYQGMASNYDYVLAMDNSNSMIVEDFKPSRFVVAKETAKDFADKLGPDNYVAVISFSSISQVETILSNDHLHVKQVINNIQLSDVGGTDLGQAIVNGANLLLQSDKGKAIVLLSDGQSNIGLPLEQAVDYANIREITIYTIGMATKEGADFFGVPLVLDEETLSYIAVNTGGKYYKVENIDELKKAYDEISNITERKISNNLSLSFVILALLLLLYEWILINTKYRTIP